MKIALDTLWASSVRTFVPYIVGGAIALLVNLGITPDPELEAAIGTAVTVVAGSVYHLIVRLLETHVSSKFGWLLGNAKQPMIYAAADGAKGGVPIVTNLEKTGVSTDTAQITLGTRTK